MNKMDLGTITDCKGRKTVVKAGREYAIIYRDIQNHNAVTVDLSPRLNYEHDGYIGHDDCEGNPHGPRFVFDETAKEVWDAMPTSRIIAVLPRREYDKMMMKIFG
jgi:hypothetical protein